jgi:hypothetical protein
VGVLLSHFLNVHRVTDLKLIEIHTAEPLVSEIGPFEVEIAATRLKNYKSLDSNSIPTEMSQA